MSLLSKLYQKLASRIDHVPDTQVHEVVDAYNSELPAGIQPINHDAWRRFEETQIEFTSGKIVETVARQAAPRGTGEIVGAIAGMVNQPVVNRPTAPTAPAGPINPT